MSFCYQIVNSVYNDKKYFGLYRANDMLPLPHIWHAIVAITALFLAFCCIFPLPPLIPRFRSSGGHFCTSCGRSSGKKTVQRKYVMMRKWPAQVTNKQCNLLLGKKKRWVRPSCSFLFCNFAKKTFGRNRK